MEQGHVESMPRIRVDHLFKVFGPHPQAALAEWRRRGGAEVDGAGGGQLYGHTFAVRDVSFEVQPGETFVVMGLSGSGKSTLVRCLNRVIAPTAGSVLLDGDDVVSMDRAQLRDVRRHKISMVFQGFALLPHRTVLDNVAFGLELRGMDRRQRHARALELIELVGLTDWATRYPDELSGGMRQRVGLARALATDADVLLMDEPFSALDPLIRRRMQDELIDLQERLHKTLIFITHDPDEALRLGSHVAIMRAGRLAQVGTPEDIVLRPADDYVASFVRQVDRTKVLRAQDIMVEPLPLLRVGTQPGVALREMEVQGLSSAFVVGPGRRLAGLVTAEGALSAVRRGDTNLAGSVMPDVKTVGQADSVRDLIPLAISAPYPLAVVDAEGRLLGIVARVAILRSLASDTAEAMEETASAEEEAPADSMEVSPV